VLGEFSPTFRQLYPRVTFNEPVPDRFPTGGLPSVASAYRFRFPNQNAKITAEAQFRYFFALVERRKEFKDIPP